LIFNAISARTKSKGFYYSYDPNFKIDLGVYNKLTTVYLYNLDGTFFKEFSSPKEYAVTEEGFAFAVILANFTNSLFGKLIIILILLI
jgi:hypothetical protein